MTCLPISISGPKYHISHESGIETIPAQKKKKYEKFPKRLKKQKKTVSEQSQDELEPIISTPINSPMSDK